MSYNVATAFAQIEKCAFECEGGPLANNTAYRWMREHIVRGPKFPLGQWVFYLVEADVSGVKVGQWVKLCVVGVSMASDTERQTWRYALSNDPPQPYHYGTAAQFTGIAEGLLFETDPGTPRPPAESDAGVRAISEQGTPAPDTPQNPKESRT